MRLTRLASSLILLAVILLPFPAFAAEPIDPTALSAAENFLYLLDNDDYQTAWALTNIINQGYTTYPEWFKKVLTVRPHLGHVIERSLTKTSLHTSWVGLPDGEYIRLSFTTVFHNKNNSLETVLLSREGNFWSVGSYHLR